MNMQPPLQRTANQLSDYGRFGDSTLVHMNPAEVRGLASMSPTGELTINPVTGQPEAFLPFLAPIFGSLLGSAALGGTALGAAGAGALGSGLATWAATGDFEKGLISGVTGFGLGKILGAGADAAHLSDELAGLQGAQQAVSETGTALGGQPIPEMLAGPPLPTSLGYNPATGVTGGGLGAPLTNISGGLSPEQLAFVNAKSGFGNAQNALEAGRAALTPGQRAGAMFSGEGLKGMVGALKDPAAVIPLGIGAGTQANVAQQEEMEKLRRENTARDSRYAQRWRDTLTDSLGMARGSNPNPYAGRYASGGIVGYNGGGDILGNTPDHTNAMSDAEYRDLWGDVDVDELAGLGTGAFGLDDDSRYTMDRTKLTPDSGAYRQSYLRGDIKQRPPTDYRHGFEKEFQFFDFIEDRPIERYADLFGAGSSNYLAGLLAGNVGDAPTTVTDEAVPGTYSESTITCYPDDGGEAFDVTDVNPSCPVGSSETAPAPTLRKTCYVVNEDGTYGTALADLTGVCPVGYYDSEAAADAAAGGGAGTDPLVPFLDMFERYRAGTATLSEIAAMYGWSEEEALSIINTWMNLPTNGGGVEPTPQEQCELAGGVWDGENCDMTGEPQECPAGMWRDPQTGECVGCPAPETLIKLKDGDTTAGELKVGDLVHTQHEDTLEWGDWPVTGVQIIENQRRLKLSFDDNEIVCSWSHKFYVDGKEWVKAEDMKKGDVVSGSALDGVRPWEDGDVVKITVDEAHTYVAADLLSHNKSLAPCPEGQHHEYVEGEGWTCVPNTVTGEETTITCYNQETGESQSVTGVNPSCPTGWAETQPPGTETTITCYNLASGESQSVTAVNPSCPTGWSTEEPVPAWLETLQGISPEVDGDYSQEEADAIVSLIDSDFDKQRIADYYGMTVDELMGYYNTIKGGGDGTPEWQTALNEITAVGDVDGDYSQEEADAIYDLYMRQGATAQQIADYYGMTVEEFQSYVDQISSQRGITATLNAITPASEVDGDYSQTEADEIYELYMTGGATAQQIADYYNMSVDDFLAYVNQISTAKAGDTGNVAIDTTTLTGAGTVKDVTEDQVATVIGDTTSVDAGQMPEGDAWDTMGAHYIGDDAGTLEAAYATADYDNMMEQQQNIRNFVADNYGEPPYSQEQALDFAAGAIGAGLAAEEVAAALGIDLATVQALYDAVSQSAATGGRVGTRQFMTPAGRVYLQAGGIADIPVEAPMPEQVVEETFVEETVDTDYPELVDMTIEAIKGNIEDSDAVIEQFIAEYGAEAFQELRDAVLKSVAGNPEAQTEGVISGAGAGMDDEVMGVIGQDQEIAVSPGEYIVAADVVSGLGDGSSDAGADVLDVMMQDVRNARTGGRQPKKINRSAVMPA